MQLIQHIKEHAILGILAEKFYNGQGNTIEGVGCGSGLLVGDAVYVNGNNNVAPAIATSLVTAKVVGFCISKETANECTIVTTGLVAGFGSLIYNTPYFLSKNIAGAITSIPPSGDGDILVHLGVAWDTDRLLLNINPNLIVRRV